MTQWTISKDLLLKQPILYSASSTEGDFSPLLWTHTSFSIRLPFPGGTWPVTRGHEVGCCCWTTSQSQSPQESLSSTPPAHLQNMFLIIWFWLASLKDILLLTLNKVFYFFIPQSVQWRLSIYTCKAPFHPRSGIFSSTSHALSYLVPSTMSWDSYCY